AACDRCPARGHARRPPPRGGLAAEAIAAPSVRTWAGRAVIHNLCVATVRPFRTPARGRILQLHVCTGVHTMDEFEWDAPKAAVNRRKHGIDFADVTAVFEDDRGLTVEDEIT